MRGWGHQKDILRSLLREAETNLGDSSISHYIHVIDGGDDFGQN